MEQGNSFIKMNAQVPDILFALCSKCIHTNTCMHSWWRGNWI